MKNIAVFASGQGTNAEKLIKHFKDSEVARVSLLLCNKKNAPAIEKAEKQGIPVVLIEDKNLFNSPETVSMLKAKNVDYIVLAGFLWKVPNELVIAFPNKIINIHPSLLPKYGGKGMYGEKVHKAVIDAGDKQSGISIHYVNEEFDKGEIIFQASCTVENGENVEQLSKKIHNLEHNFFARITEQVILQNL